MVILGHFFGAEIGLCFRGQQLHEWNHSDPAGNIFVYFPRAEPRLFLRSEILSKAQLYFEVYRLYRLFCPCDFNKVRLYFEVYRPFLPL